MGLGLDTNLPSIRALNHGTTINSNLEGSIRRLSSGRKITLAEDDASGIAISSSLNNQFVSLQESIKNANDGIGVMQIADAGIGKQIDLLTKIRVKAISAANDIHSKTSVLALQQEITKLTDELDRIAETTTYNGLSLLSGDFINKDFHIGSKSESFARFSIESTQSKNLGVTRYETGVTITASSLVKLKFIDLEGRDWHIDDAIVSHSANTGIVHLASEINKSSHKLGIKARATVLSTGHSPIGDGLIKSLEINNIFFGNIDTNSKTGKSSLVKIINAEESKTGVRAFLDTRGHLAIESLDGRGIYVRADSGADLLGLDNASSPSGHRNYGRLTLTQLNDPRDIIVSGSNYTSIGFGNGAEAQDTININNIKKHFTIAQACAMGMYNNQNSSRLEQDKTANLVQSGVLTTLGAQAIIDSVDISIKNLSTIRSEVAAMQIRLRSAADDATTLSSNLASAKSQIVDTNYAEESHKLNTYKILLQANIFALSKSKSIKDLLLELLR